MHTFRKTLIILSSTILILIVGVVLFISPITKYLVEKYDEKYTGRQITMNWAYVNPFTGYIHFSNLKVYELKSDSVFFSAEGVSANIAMIKLFSKTYEISEFTLNHPMGVVIQNKNDFNFTSLIEKLAPKDSIPTPAKAPVHFSILDVKISEGAFYYHEKEIPINYFIKNVAVESSGLRWDADTIATTFSFLPGIGSGDIKGNFVINLKTLDYHSAVVIHKFNLNIIAQYLKDLTNYGSFRANLDADIKAKGNFKDEENVSTTGLLAITDFHFGKNPKEDYASFDKLILAMNDISPKKHTYLFDSISFSHPYFKYERYDKLDNVQTMFGKNGSNIKAANADDAQFNLIIEIANYIKVVSKNFLSSPYKINRLAIYKADLRFNDYSLSEEFSAGLSPLSFTADSIDRNHKRVEFFLNSGIKPYGNLAVTLSINPKDSTNFDIRCRLQKIPLSLFNPYLLSYTSFPLDRGSIEFTGIWNVRHGIIQSTNHLVILDPRVSKRIRNKDTKWIPVPLIMAFIRERGNVIDYEIPITGDLKNPKFHIWGVLLDLLENMVVKPVTTPYRIEVKNTEAEIEKSLTLKWQMHYDVIQSSEEKFIEKIVEFLEKNPNAYIDVYPEHYALKEKEYILFFEAKKKYFLTINNTKHFNEADSERIDKMSVKDSFLVHFLNKRLNDPLLFTIQEKCARFIDPAIIEAKFKQLNTEREKAFLLYFKKGAVEKQVKIHTGKNVIPYNGFSFYKIVYKGEFPEPLIKAYHKINELNDEAPRKKFEKEREKNKTSTNVL